MNIDDLSSELKDKALACKNPEELLALAAAEGYELTEEELESVAGGGDWYSCTNYTSTSEKCPGFRH